MDGTELFNAIDTDNSKVIQSKELSELLYSMKNSLRQKDLSSIVKYFFRNEEEGLDRSSFQTSYDRACATVKKHKASKNELLASKPEAAEDEFAEADLAEADQGMFSDAFATVKGWFGGKKEKFANLDQTIPGYSAMSPRSRCDKAVSELIK